MDEDNKTRSGRPPVVLLKDLAPRKTIKGGSGKVLFGQGVPPSDAPVGAKNGRKNGRKNGKK